MSPTRRTFLAFLGISAVTPSLLTADERPKLKRSRWDLLFSNGPMAEPRHRPSPATWSDETLTVAWIGHATVLINFYGTWILTDPVFSEKIGVRILGYTLGPRRLVAPAMEMDALPDIDLLLLSHAHLDHLDLPSLESLKRDMPVIMAKNTKDVVEDLEFRDVRELDWGEKTTAVGIEIEALRVKHFGWRWPWENDRSRGYHDGRSYNAYILTKNGTSILFAGDTALQPYFAEAGKNGRAIDLAMMPIGAYDPWIHAHCNPEQAVAMAEQIGASHVMPMHWGTFIQSDEPDSEPIRRFTDALAASRLKGTLTAHGQTWTLGRA